MTDERFLCPVCGWEAPVDFGDDEWLCPKCDHLWLGEVVRGEQVLISDTMAVRDDDGTYGLYELWYVDDPDTAVVVELRFPQRADGRRVQISQPGSRGRDRQALGKGFVELKAFERSLVDVGKAEAVGGVGGPAFHMAGVRTERRRMPSVGGESET